MNRTAINAKQIRYSEFRIPKTQPQPQNRRKKEFTIIDEEELEEIRQAMIQLQKRVIELEKEKLEKRDTTPRFSITDDDETTERYIKEKEKLLKRNSPPQKRHSLPIQLQRNTPPRQRNSPPQKRHSLPIQLQRNTLRPNQRNSLPTIKEDRRLSSPKLCRRCKKNHAKSGEYCSYLCELGDHLRVPVANKGAR